MLKKEFKRKDVQRARNLIMGKTGDSTGTQIGYKKEIKEYKEGDIWNEGRKTWTIKNGIKQTVSKLDKLKKEVFSNKKVIEEVSLGFKNLAKSSKTISEDRLKEIYDEIYYDIPIDGKDSHKNIVEQTYSKVYAKKIS